MEDLYTRLTRLLEKKGSNPYQLAKATGIYSGFITDLKMGRQKSMLILKKLFYDRHMMEIFRTSKNMA